MWERADDDACENLHKKPPERGVLAVPRIWPGLLDKLDLASGPDWLGNAQAQTLQVRPKDLKVTFQNSYSPAMQKSVSDPELAGHCHHITCV